MTHRARMPRTHRPRVHLLCPKCNSATTVIMSTANHDGQHRRHRCKDEQCLYTFYSLSPFNGGTIQISNSMFKNRPLNDIDRYEREKAWNEFEEQAPVTTKGNYPILDAMRTALDTDESDRTQRQHVLAGAYGAVLNIIQRMERSINDNGE